MLNVEGYHEARAELEKEAAAFAALHEVHTARTPPVSYTHLTLPTTPYV